MSFYYDNRYFLEKGNGVDLTHLDLSKAFDTVAYGHIVTGTE